MKQVVIDNPVINSPFEEPQRHFRFTDDGITDEIVKLRRFSAYFIPIAKPKKKGHAPYNASKTYYPMFFAAQALLKADDIDVLKHSAVEPALAIFLPNRQGLIRNMTRCLLVPGGLGKLRIMIFRKKS